LRTGSPNLFDEATRRADFPPLWVAELFANIGSQGYIAEVGRVVLLRVVRRGRR
jgi:hypothetical protein